MPFARESGRRRSLVLVGAVVVALGIAPWEVARPQRPPAGQPRDQRPASTLWGDLEPGAHAVGFRVIRATDVTRPPFPEDRTARGRDVPVFVWYPARRPGTERPFALAHYLDELGGGQRGSLGVASRATGTRAFVGHAAELGGDTAVLSAALPGLLAQPTRAYANARPAAGRHPVFLFSAYLAPATNSILAEFLASHGFVVVSTPLLGSFDRTPDISTRGLETQADDLRFALSVVDTLAFVDGRRVAAGGVGINASGALALALRDARVRSLVSLEGGVTTEGEVAMIRQSPFFDVTAARAPILAITAPHPDVDANRLDVYRYATRYLVHFPRSSEFWFTNWGMLDPLVPGIIGPPPSAPRASFEWAARYIRRFLDTTLLGDSSAAATLALEPGRAGVPAELGVTSETRRALPPPPTLAELTTRLERNGVAGIRAFVAERRPPDAQPVTVDQFARLQAWLANGRDADWRARRDLAELRAELYPESVRAHYTLAVATRAAGDTAAALDHFRAALERLGSDQDPTLGASRGRLERLIRDALGLGR